MWDSSMALPKGASQDNVLRGSGVKNMPPGVPPLVDRWEASMDFGMFTDKTLK